MSSLKIFSLIFKQEVCQKVETNRWDCCTKKRGYGGLTIFKQLLYGDPVAVLQQKNVSIFNQQYVHSYTSFLRLPWPVCRLLPGAGTCIFFEQSGHLLCKIAHPRILQLLLFFISDGDMVFPGKAIASTFFGRQARLKGDR